MNTLFRYIILTLTSCFLLPIAHSQELSNTYPTDIRSASATDTVPSEDAFMTASAAATYASGSIPEYIGDVWPDMPMPAQLRAVTMPTPALSTGAAVFSVPLYELKFKDLTLPISLAYRSNGIKVNEDPFPIGYGWSFLPALRITRKVMGRPDGYQARAIPDGVEAIDANLGHSILHRSIALHGRSSNPELDPEYDLFTVFLPHRTLNAYYSEGKLISPGNTEYRITVKDSFKSFEVTSPDGIIWNFSTNGLVNTQSVTCEWCLTDITLPSGETLGFEWQKGVHSIQPDAKPSIRQNFYAMPLTASVPNGKLDGYIEGPRVEPDGFMNLKKITFPGGSIMFSYDYTSTNISTVLKSMKVYNETQEVESFLFTHETMAHDATLLKSVRTTDGSTYTFTYNSGRFTKEGSQDYWGFYNGKNNSSLLAPRMTVNNLGRDNASMEFYGCDRRVDVNNMKAMILEKAIYPTGAVTEWEYEVHKFKPVSFRDNGITGTLDSELSFGGGLRVKEIRILENSDDTSPRVVKYSYGSNGNGLAQVEDLPTASTFLENLVMVAPRFTLEECPNTHNDWLLCEYGILMFNPYSSYSAKRFGEEIIWYDEVTELYDEGKTVHHFFKPLSNQVYHWDLGAIVPDSIQTWFSGDILESKTEIFKQSGNSHSLVESTVFKYDIESGKKLSGLHIHRNKTQVTIAATKPDFNETKSLHFPWETIPEIRDFPTPPLGVYYQYYDGDIYTPIVYSISTDISRLKSKTHTEYTTNLPYTVTEEYTYKEGTQLLLSRTEKNTAQTVTTSYSYPEPKDSRGALMIAANVVGMPVGGSITCGSGTLKWSADISAFSNNRYFRVSSLDLQRGSNPTYRFSSYTYSSGGELKSIRNFGETEVSYTWDSYGRYPLSMSVGNTLTSKAEWKPLVGVSSLTDPAGVKTAYSYDSGNRLMSVSVNGKIREGYTYNINGNGDNSITSKRYSSQSQYTSTINRYDGLGRLHSSYNETPDGWIGSLNEYDVMGRPWRSWIPVYTTSTTLSRASLSQQAISASGDSKPYRETQYEDSPRGIVVSETVEGAAWHDKNKSKQTTLFTNDSKSHQCNRYTITDTGVTKNGLWPDGSLLVSLHKDEDGLSVEIFKDIMDNTVCEKRGGVATYYIYDDYGDLRYILPPGIEDGGKRTARNMQGLAYWYDYDERGRCVLKKLPGAKSHLLRYDPDNRLVAERTINHPDNVWRIHAYDRCSRAVISIDCTLTESELAIYTSGSRTASMTGASSLCGYMISGSPSSKITGGNVVTASFYDTYDFIAAHSLGDSFTFKHPLTELDFTSRVSDKSLVCTTAGNAKGRLTGVYTGSGWEVYYYDDEGREIQRYATGYNRGYRTTVYNYDGSVAGIHYCYNRPGSPSPETTEISGLRDRDIHNTYDKIGRLVKRSIIERYRPKNNRLSKTDSAVLVYTYDNVGRLSRIKKGVTGSNFDYDIHGWMKSISTPLKKTTFSESIKYENGPSPRFNGFISQHSWNNYVFAYTYDSHGFLLQSKYAGSDSTTGYTTQMQYDVRGNIISLDRKGVIDLLPSGTKVLGTLENFVATYQGNRMRRISVQSDAEVFDRKPGLYKTGLANVNYDKSGRVTYDPSRGILSISYDNNGHPSSLEIDDGKYLVTNKIDGFGQRLGTTVTETSVVDRVIEETEYTGDGHVIRNGVLEMSRFPGGYFDADVVPHYYITDNQGNNIGVYDGQANLEQQVSYYPYGEPWLEPEYADRNVKNRYLFGNKERLSVGGANEYDFHARSYAATQGRFTSIDPLAEKTPWLSPYAYCAGNPVNYVDPTGCKITGVSKRDAAMAVEDFREMFPGDEFVNFRNLITQSGKHHNGKSFESISSDALSAAFNGITLNEDQQALVDMVVNTINSKDTHKVEYINSTGTISYSAQTIFSPQFEKKGFPMDILINANNGFPVLLIQNRGGGGLTTPIRNGTYSLIYKDSSFHDNGRPVTTGHEIIGHGRSLAIGRGDTNQHRDAIQTENLILRVMGIPYINTGAKHVKNGAFPECSKLPNFR